MPDEMTTAPETGATGDAGAGVNVGDVTIRDTPDASGMVPASEVAGLKSAFEKLKGENAKLKPLAKLLEDGIDPETLPSKLAQLKEQEALNEQMAQARAEWESASRAEREKTEQANQAQIKALSTYLQSQTRDNALTDVFMAGGGQSQSKLDAQQFKQLVNGFVEWEDTPIRDDAGAVIAYESKIKKFKDTKGDTLFVDDSKTGQVREAKLEDFLAHIKQGKYGVALQNMLPAYNQSSGAGISSTGGTGSNGLLLIKRSQMANLGTLSPDALAAVKAGKYQVVD